MIQASQLEDFFSRYGWNISLASPNLWNSGFQGHLGYYSLKASLTDTYLSLEVCPLIDTNLFCEQSFCTIDERFLKNILCLNNDLQFVKLGLNIKGELSLSCQIINMDINFEKFKRAVEILGYYSDELREYFHNFMNQDQISPHHQA